VPPGRAIAHVLIELSAAMTALMMAAVLVERTYIGLRQLRWRYLERRYSGLLAAGLEGDRAALTELIESPPRHRYSLAMMLARPLIGDRSPDRIAKTRALAKAMFLMDLADWYLHSPLWWRRALALRGLGMIQSIEHTKEMIAALDDDHDGVRAAALDALADLRNPASLPAIVVRLNDATLHRGRRFAALAAFGDQCEPLLLDLAAIDPAHRANYARALAISGTARARAALCEWVRDGRPDVRVAALRALAHVRLDDHAAAVVRAALDDEDGSVRAAACEALYGWQGDDGTVRRVAHLLDDDWAVAWQAARALSAMGEAGRSALEARASQPQLPGLLARQMLWQAARP
jgi:HEAT repeat protein